MTEIRKIILILLAIGAMVAAGSRAGTAIAAQTTGAQAQNTSAVPDTKGREKNLAIGEAEAKQLLLLMDQDQSGKVSKKEFMSFMEAEFQRLDVNKDGELDVKELTQSRLVPRGGRHR